MLESIDLHHPEIADNGKPARLLELLGLKERLKDSSERRAVFSDMTDEDYQRMIGYINSVTRAKPISYEYQNGALPMLDTPPAEAKEALMNLTYQTVRGVLSDEELSDEVALRRAGLTLAGAINYIHPYDDGNGRTGRVLHYLVEYGVGRGDQAFNDELYAIIAKLPLYEGDSVKALADQPPAQLESALDKLIPSELISASFHMGDRAAASARVIAFLDMMLGNVKVPITEKVTLRPGLINNDMTPEKYEPGEIDGLTLYEKQYVALSSIPQRNPSEYSSGRKKSLCNPSKNGAFFRLPVDIV